MELNDDNDPGRWGHSLGNASALLEPCLDVVEAKSVVEVGAYAGDLTRELLTWAERSGAKITAIDPTPAPELHQLAEERPDLTVIHKTSHEGLAEVEMPDAVIIDGDHNYYTVHEELRIVHERAGDQLPLLLFHDVCWPHARRDTFYAPERIPEDQIGGELVEGAGVFPGEPGLTEHGLPYKWAVREEGGPKNGVLTAVEDFVEEHGLKLAILPVFFGFGVVWSEKSPWAAKIEEFVAPYDRHPTITALEANRVFHLATSQQRHAENWLLENKLARQEHLLRTLLESSAFTLADRVSHLKSRGGVSWREQIEQALED